MCRDVFVAVCVGLACEGVDLRGSFFSLAELLKPRIICVDDEVVVGRLARRDVPFGVSIPLDIAMAVEVVWSEVQQQGHIGFEGHRIFELETRGFHHPDVTVAFGPLLGVGDGARKTGSDVSSATGIQPALVQEVVQ